MFSFFYMRILPKMFQVFILSHGKKNVKINENHANFTNFPFSLKINAFSSFLSILFLWTGLMFRYVLWLLCVIYVRMFPCHSTILILKIEIFGREILFFFIAFAHGDFNHAIHWCLLTLLTQHLQHLSKHNFGWN